MNVRESMGVALVASHLADVDGDRETPVMRVRAFGAAQITRAPMPVRGDGSMPWLHADADGAVQVRRHESSEPPRIAALMFRAKYAGDRSAVRVLVPAMQAHVRKHAQARGWPMAASPLLGRCVGQVLDEWLHDTCAHCQGRGMVPAQRSLHRVRALPRGTRMVVCRQCQGTQRRRATDGERARAIGLPREVFGEQWARIFGEIQSLTDTFDTMFVQRLRRQLWIG